jgi:hypothetical protein
MDRKEKRDRTLAVLIEKGLLNPMHGVPEFFQEVAEAVAQVWSPAVSEEDVQTIMLTIKGAWPGEMDQLYVKPGWEEGYGEGRWVICLEGGPENWPYVFSTLVFEGKHHVPDGVGVEAYTGWALSVYPKPVA